MRLLSSGHAGSTANGQSEPTHETAGLNSLREFANRLADTPILVNDDIETQKPITQVERLVHTFVAPSATFTDIRRSADWFWPCLLLAIASAALALVAVENAGVGSGAELLAVAYPVRVVTMLAISAAVLMGAFNIGLHAELTFNQCLAVCMYASLPLVIKDLIAMLTITVGRRTFSDPVPSNFGALVHSNSHVLNFLATSLDIFTIWTLVLAGIGFSCLTKVKRRVCMGVVVGCWGVVVLAWAGISAR
jgi:Yip1 domain